MGKSVRKVWYKRMWIYIVGGILFYQWFNKCGNVMKRLNKDITEFNIFDCSGNTVQYGSERGEGATCYIRSKNS